MGESDRSQGLNDLQRIEIALSDDAGKVCIECGKKPKLYWSCIRCWHDRFKDVPPDERRELYAAANKRWGREGKGPFNADA